MADTKMYTLLNAALQRVQEMYSAQSDGVNLITDSLRGGIY